MSVMSWEKKLQKTNIVLTSSHKNISYFFHGQTDHYYFITQFSITIIYNHNLPEFKPSYTVFTYSMGNVFWFERNYHDTNKFFNDKLTIK